MKKARRYDNGKPKYHLIPPSFLKELAKVYTIGAEKYTIRDNEGNIQTGFPINIKRSPIQQVAKVVTLERSDLYNY